MSHPPTIFPNSLGSTKPGSGRVKAGGLLSGGTEPPLSFPRWCHDEISKASKSGDKSDGEQYSMLTTSVGLSYGEGDCHLLCIMFSKSDQLYQCKEY